MPVSAMNQLQKVIQRPLVNSLWMTLRAKDTDAIDFVRRLPNLHELSFVVERDMYLTEPDITPFNEIPLRQLSFSGFKVSPTFIQSLPHSLTYLRINSSNLIQQFSHATVQTLAITHAQAHMLGGLHLGSWPALKKLHVRWKKT